jgi:cytochrome c oxidase subunit 1
MVRRTWKYAPEAGLETWNVAVSIGAFIIAAAIAVFIYNWYHSRRHGEPSGIDPWDARTIEWTIPNPTPEWNYGVSPVVSRLDDFWHQKYDEDEEGRPVRRPDAEELLQRLEDQGLNPPAPIHLPAPSYFPFFMALGIPLGFYGIIYHTSVLGKVLILIGAVIMLSAVIGWAIEPLEEPEDASSPHGEDVGEPASPGEAEAVGIADTTPHEGDAKEVPDE